VITVVTTGFSLIFPVTSNKYTYNTSIRLKQLPFKSSFINHHINRLYRIETKSIAMSIERIYWYCFSCSYHKGCLLPLLSTNSKHHPLRLSRIVRICSTFAAQLCVAKYSLIAFICLLLFLLTTGKPHPLPAPGSSVLCSTFAVQLCVAKYLLNAFMALFKIYC
jgi:hypothetical protein